MAGVDGIGRRFIIRSLPFWLAVPSPGRAALPPGVAADQGGAAGQTSLGVFYEQGRGGLPNDDREAARLYRLAADQGEEFGQKNLGSLYEQGRGGLPKDEREAVRLCQMAARSGQTDAQKRLRELGQTW